MTGIQWLLRSYKANTGNFCHGILQTNKRPRAGVWRASCYLYTGKDKVHDTDRTRDVHGRRGRFTVWSKIPEEIRSRGASRQRRGKGITFLS